MAQTTDSNDVPRRLGRLRSIALDEGLFVAVASTPLARALGLAWLRELPPHWGLLIPRCASVHTFGMRFALDLLFFDAAGDLIRMRERVDPLRVAGCRHAGAVLEVTAGVGRRFARQTPLSCARTFP